MKEEIYNPLESLQLIDSMINKARNNFSENGHLYLVWGWCIFVCSLGHFLFEMVWPVKNFYLVWMSTWLVLIYQIFYLVKKRKAEKVLTYTDAIVKQIWFVFVIVMFLMMVIIARFSTISHHTDAVFLVIYGIPTYLSGKIIRHKWLVYGGIGCWLLAIGSLFIPYPYHMLLLSVAVIIAWIIPGYMLRKRFKLQGKSSLIQ